MTMHVMTCVTIPFDLQSFKVTDKLFAEIYKYLKMATAQTVTSQYMVDIYEVYKPV